jgi:RimJ/RimL family protein N-acetyltransferase
MSWTTEAGELLLVEPTLAEATAHAIELASAYNEPENARLMGHEELLTSEDVIEHYRAVIEGGGRPFLLYLDGVLVGDADLRGPRAGAAEFAFLIASRDRQGKGLGTRLALMVHAAAFDPIGLQRVYASIDPTNPASRRALEKLGYRATDTEEARSFANEPGDVTMVLEREAFLRLHGSSIARLRLRGGTLILHER